jgi:hypothetical protein
MDALPQLSLDVGSSRQALTVRVILPGPATQVEIRLFSRRNDTVSRQTDRSPRRTSVTPTGGRPPPPAGCELWFPVVDLAVRPPLEAVVCWRDAAGARVTPNGYRQGDSFPCGARTVLPAAWLDHWENALFVEGGGPGTAVERFYLRQRVALMPAVQPEVALELPFLGSAWAGRIEATATLGTTFVAEGAVEVGAASEPGATARPGISSDRPRHADQPDLSAEALRASLLESARYLARAIHTTPDTALTGGLHTFYDYDAQTWRLPHWMWGWGPPMAALLAAAKGAEPRESAGFRAAAQSIGECSLRFVIWQSGSPWHGLGPTRWDFDWRSRGCTQFVTGGSDALFLCAWGWLPLYHDTGDTRYLDAAVALGEAVARLMDQFELIPQDYKPVEGEWTNHTLDESGFGVEGFRALYQATGDERFRAWGGRYLDQHLAKFERADGLWERCWLHREGRADPCNRMTRGQSWAMAGLLAGWELTGNVAYLDRARRMGTVLLAHQRRDGAWTAFFDRSEDEVGVDEKGTAIWSLWFFRLHRATGEPAHREAAERALRWCLAHQDRDASDPEARGGVPGVQLRSGVIYRDWFKLSCTYTSGFFGLAAVAWLELEGRPSAPAAAE